MTEDVKILPSMKDDWKVRIDTFEGPLDLLLFLIRKNNMDIYNIQIAEITNEFLGYLDVMKHLSIDNVGDFLVMASILMYIKSQMLLPSPDAAEEGEENAEEMKRNLIARLLEYKKYKESASYLREREEIFDGIMPIQQYPVQEFGTTVDVTLYDLIDAFQKLIKNAKGTIKDIITEEISVEDKIRFIMSIMENRPLIGLGDILDENSSVMELIVTLLAILELIRTKQIKVRQEIRFGKISLELNTDRVDIEEIEREMARDNEKEMEVTENHE